MKDKVGWVSIAITLIVMLLTFGVTWGTLSTRVNAVESRIVSLENEYQTINDKLDIVIMNQVELQTKMKYLIEGR
jgi:peptidoglycan hydrolase CwlO-like protein